MHFCRPFKTGGQQIIREGVRPILRGFFDCLILLCPVAVDGFQISMFFRKCIDFFRSPALLLSPGHEDSRFVAHILGFLTPLALRFIKVKLL